MGGKTATEFMQEELLRTSRMLEPYRGFLVESERLFEINRIANSSQLDVISKAAEAARLSLSAVDLASSVLSNPPLSALAIDLVEQAKAIEYARRSVLGGIAQFAISSVQLMDKFRMPAMEEIVSLTNVLHAQEGATRSIALQADFISAAQSFGAAWINVDSPLSSLRAAYELNGIGNALNSLQPFGSHLTDILRPSLGDWRNLTIPPQIYETPLERIDFYAGQGFNLELTHFPVPAFSLILDAAKLRPKSLPLTVRKHRGGFAIDSEADESMMGFAYDLLFTLESRMRKFISEVMVTRFGEQWFVRQVPGEMRRDWETKRSAALEHGEAELDLIAYADFTDYVTIICRRDNWEGVFRRVFLRKENVQEAFYRLFPVRLCTMHARPITLADLLLLIVESERLLKAIGVDS